MTVSQPMLTKRTHATHFWVYTALLIALGVLVPMLFHQFGIAGKVFLPMHFPVIIAGFLFGPFSGLLVGFFSPVLSFLLTGMPPFPTVLMMVPELITYGAMSGWLYTRFKINVWIALPAVIVAGRIVYGLAWWPMVHILGFHPGSQKTISGLVILGITIGLPGIISQLVLIPLFIKKFSHNRVDNKEDEIVRITP